MIGQDIPPFILPMYPGNTEFNSASLTGTWSLLHFFYAAFSGVCATELTLLSQVGSELPVQVVSICPDSMMSIVAWVDIELSKMSNITNLTIISDSSRIIRQGFGIGKDERAVFIIDPDSVIQAEIRQPAAIGINIHECLRVLQALQYAYGPDGQCTPADWEPGKPGIPPGASQIGQTWRMWPIANKDPM